MNGLIPFETTITQTTETIPCPQKITAANNLTYNYKRKRATALQVGDTATRGESRIFLGGGAPLRNGVTNTNKPHFFCRISVVLESLRSSQGVVRTPCTLPLDPPLPTLKEEQLVSTGKTIMTGGWGSEIIDVLLGVKE